MKEVRGKPAGRGLRLGIVVSRFNEEVTGRLLQGALSALDDAGVAGRRITVVSVPGAFEIPSAAQLLARSKSVDAVVCLGAVIQGETSHSDFVASAAQEGVIRVGLDEAIPVTFGVLTTDTVEQALERSGGRWGNKGAEAAIDALEMVDLFRKMTG